MQGWLSFLAPEHFILSPFRTNQTLGFITLVVVFLGFGTTCLQRGISTLLLATIPAFIALSRSSLSEVSGALSIAAAFVLFKRASRDNRFAMALWASALLGFACNMRLQLIFFSPVVLLASLFGPGPLARRFTNAIICGGVFVLAFIPTLYMNYSLFGSPLITGYHFWVPGSTTREYTFGFRHVGENLRMLGRELFLTYDNFHVANFFGTGAYFTPAFVVLSAVGLARIKRKQVVIPVAASILTFFVASLLYFFCDDSRLYFPLLVLMVWVASEPVAAAISAALRRRIHLGTFTVLALFILSIVGTPSLAGWPPRYSWSQLFELMRMDTMGARSPEFEAAVYASKMIRKGPVILLSDVSSPYLSTFLPNEDIVAPLDGQHAYRYSNEWHFDADDAFRLARTGLQSNIRVLALATNSRDIASFVERLPKVDGGEWTEVQEPRRRRTQSPDLREALVPISANANSERPALFRLMKIVVPISPSAGLPSVEPPPQDTKK